MVRFVEHLPGRYNGIGQYIEARDCFLPVPICLSCWLTAIASAWGFQMRGVRRDDPVDRAGPVHPTWQWQNEIRRLRCEWCDRPLRVNAKKFQQLPLHSRCCCSDCLHKAKLRRNNVRRRVHHERRACVVCGTMYTPTQSTQKTCSSTCRQRLYRQWHAG